VNVPLFPLRTVLYPGGPLPLRIFETRYLDMISACLKADAPFGVLLIKDGAETGPALTYEVGTLASIADWYQGSDGLLGVTAMGQRRFKLHSAERRSDGLNVGEIEVLAPEPAADLPEEFRPMAELLAGVLDNLGKLYESLDKHYDDAGWLSFRFAEILPVSAETKQSYLEIEDPIERLREVAAALREVRSIAVASDD